MSILVGFILCAFGILGLFYSKMFVGPIVPILSIMMLVCGIIVIYFAHKKGQRDKAAHMLLNSKRQCPVCHINLADDCLRCPRCGAQF